MNVIEWKPEGIKKWHAIEEKTYELIFSEAKTRFEEMLSESESITNKSIKHLILFSAFMGSMGSIIIGQHACINWFMIVLLLATTFNMILIFRLLEPKHIHFRGTSPIESIPLRLDAETNEGYQPQLFYYHNIVSIQDKIDKMKSKNAERQKIYLITLRLSVFLIIVSPPYIFWLL